MLYNIISCLFLDGDGHVFISYQWGSKETVLKVSERLKAAGIKVWIDEDNMTSCKIITAINSKINIGA